MTRKTNNAADSIGRYYSDCYTELMDIANRVITSKRIGPFTSSEDLVSDTMTRLLSTYSNAERAHAPESRDHFLALSTTVMNRAAIDILRTRVGRNGRTRLRAENFTDFVDNDVQESDSFSLIPAVPDEQFQLAVAREVWQIACGMIPDSRREPFIDHLTYGIAESARRHGINKKTLQPRISTTLDSLRHTFRVESFSNGRSM